MNTCLFEVIRGRQLFLSPPEGGLDLVTNRQGANFLASSLEKA